MFNELIEQFWNTYNPGWYESSKEKFYAHPSNPERSHNFEVTIHSGDDDNLSCQIKTINLFDFLYGVHDDLFDDLHSDQEEDKLEIIGELPNGYPDYQIRKGENYISSNSFYPFPNLYKWERQFNLEKKLCIEMLVSLSDKERFYDYAMSQIQELKMHSTSFDNIEFENILNQFFKKLFDDLLIECSRVSKLQAILSEDNGKLFFNINQAGLAKIIYLLIQKEILADASADTICHFFTTNAKVLSNKQKFVPPTTLSTEYRRLTSQAQKTKTSAWLGLQTIQL